MSAGGTDTPEASQLQGLMIIYALWLDHVHSFSAVKELNVTDGYMSQGVNGTKYYRYEQQQSFSLVLSLMDRGKQLYPIHNARM